MYSTVLLQQGQSRHTYHYLKQLRILAALYQQGGTESIRAIRELSRIWPQIEAAYHWAAARHRSDEQALALCGEYAEAGGDLLSIFQPLPEQIAWLRLGLSAASQLGDSRGRVHHLIRLAAAYLTHDSHAQALTTYEQALAAARAIRYQRGEAEALIGIGRVKSLTPVEAHEAREALQAGLRLFRMLKDQDGIGHSLQSLSLLEQMGGNLELAETYALEALAIFRRASHPHRIASALHRLGAVAVRAENYEQGKVYIQESIMLARALGDQQLIAQGLSRLGLLEDRLGDPGASQRCFEQMLVLARDGGMKDAESLALMNLAWLARSQGQLSAAEALYRDVVELAMLTGYRLRAAFAIEELGYLYLQTGQIDDARDYLCRGLALLQELRAEPFDLMYALTGFAWLALLEGDPERAARILGAVTHHPQYYRTEPEQAYQDQRVLGMLADALPGGRLRAVMEAAKEDSIETLVAALPPCESSDIE